MGDESLPTSVGDVLEHGDRRCTKCGKPHDLRVVEVYPARVTRNDAIRVKVQSWAANDGHPYCREPWEQAYERLRYATEGLLDWAERFHAGDPSLDPEEWYINRDFAQVVLGRV